MPAVTESTQQQASTLAASMSSLLVNASSGEAGSPSGWRRSRVDFVRRSRLSRLHVHLVLLLLVAFVPTAGLLLRTTLEQHRHSAAIARQDGLRWARVLAGEHERAIETARQLLTMLAQVPAVRQQRPDRCNALVTDLLRRYSRYANLGAVTLNGSVFCSAGPPGEPLDLGGGAHFWRAVENGGFEVGEYRIDRATGRTTVNLSYPLIDDTGAVQGAVFAAIDLTWLTQLPALTRLPEGWTLTISDRQGRVRFRFPDPAKWVGRVAWDPTIVNRMAALGEGWTDAAGPEAGGRFVGFTLLPSADGGESAYLAVSIPQEGGLAAPDWALARTLTVLGLIAGLALAAARVIGNRIIPPHVEAMAWAPMPPAADGRRALAGPKPGEAERPGPLAGNAPAAFATQRVPAGPARPKPESHSGRRPAGERRRHPRDPVSWPVRVWLHPGWAAVGRVVDASVNGMRIVVASAGRSDLLELGGQYRVEVFIPGMENGFIRVGELRHVGDRTIGLSVEEEVPRAGIRHRQEPRPNRFRARVVEDRRRGAA